jgi:molecular chaperone Hsp33
MSAETARTGRFLRGFIHDRKIRVLAAVADGPADVLRTNHDLGSGSTVLAAESLVANVLLSAYIKGEERILLEIAGSQPQFTYSGEARSDGMVRGRFSPPDMAPAEHLKGRLIAIKWGLKKEMYRGVAEVDHDSIEGALQGYLDTSQQSPALVRLSASVRENQTVDFAAGLLVEMIPGTMEAEEFQQIVAPLLDANLREVMVGFAMGQLLGGTMEFIEARDLVFKCRCSRERVEQTLQSLGPEEVLSLIADPGFAEVTCHFCNSSYRLEPPELRALFPQKLEEVL